MVNKYGRVGINFQVRGTRQNTKMDCFLKTKAPDEAATEFYTVWRQKGAFPKGM